jgi:hypothetical protein
MPLALSHRPSPLDAAPPAGPVPEVRPAAAEVFGDAGSPEGQGAAAAIVPLALWRPEVAALLSFFFTPVFGASLHAINAWRLGDGRLLRVAAIWWVLSVSFTVSGLFLVKVIAGGVFPPMAGLLASALLAGYTLVWYAFVADRQSQLVRALEPGCWQPESWLAPVALALVILAGPPLMSWWQHGVI